MNRIIHSTIVADAPGTLGLLAGVFAGFYHSESSCRRLRVADALTGLPTSEGKRFASIFQHGSLLVEIYAPRGSDPQQPHTRDEAYFVASGTGDYVFGLDVRVQP